MENKKLELVRKCDDLKAIFFLLYSYELISLVRFKKLSFFILKKNNKIEILY